MSHNDIGDEGVESIGEALGKLFCWFLYFFFLKLKKAASLCKSKKTQQQESPKIWLKLGFTNDIVYDPRRIKYFAHILVSFQDFSTPKKTLRFANFTPKKQLQGMRKFRISVKISGFTPPPPPNIRCDPTHRA